MAMDITSYIIAKGYTDLAQLGLTSIATEGSNIILTRKDGSTATVTVPTPENGKDGISITNVAVDKNNQLICTMSDGSIIAAGEITIDSSKLNLDNYYTKGKSDELYINKEDIDAITSDEIKELFSNK